MKILHVTNAYPYPNYESFGIFIKEQIDSLNSTGVINKVIFINARKNGSPEYLRKVKEIRNNVNSFNPDVIHCHHEFSLLPFLFIKFKKPIILSLLGDIKNRSILNKIIFKLLSIKTQHIIIKNKNLNKTKYSYLPNGVNTSLFKEIDKNESKDKLNLNKNQKYILFVTASLNNPIKRYDKFENVIAHLNINNTQSNYQPLILSGVKRELVPYYFNAAEILLLTSDHEGSPNAVKEAMACNLPVVSTDVGNVRELIKDSNSNFISKSGTVEELVKLTLLALEINKSDGLKKLIESELDIEIVAKKLLNIYKDQIK